LTLKLVSDHAPQTVYPIVARKDNLVVATGGFRLGWSFAPAIGRYAADLALGKVKSYPHISKYAERLHSGRLD